MLFGKETLRQEVINDIREIEDKENVRVIYAAETGSISRGIPTFYSDYDTRFLYINKDFPNRIYNPDECCDADIKKLIYPQKEEYFTDKYELREMTSFLHFLIFPSIGGVCKGYGLYYYLGWTFTAPYIWDPYGLNCKLLPLMNSIFRQDYMLKYHVGFMNTEILSNSQSVNAKLYFRYLYSAMSIEWSLLYHTFPPAYFKTLSTLCGNEKITEEYLRLYSEYYSMSLDFKSREAGEKGHGEVRFMSSPIVNDYIIKMKQEAVKWLIQNDGKYVIERDRHLNIVNSMYEIIETSINEPKVNGVNC